MNYFKIFFGSSLLFVTALIIIFFKVSTSEHDRSSALVIGTATGYAPFVSMNAQGEYEGFDIDVSAKLAERLGKKLIIKNLGSMVPLFIALEQGTIDAIIWGLSITPDRLKKVNMVRYQGTPTTTYYLLFWKEIPSGISTLKDMQQKTVCIEPGSTQEAFLDKFTEINKLFTEKIDDALLNLQYGKSDAALVESTIAKKFKNKYPELQTLEVPLSANEQVQGIGIAINPLNKNLIQDITQAIEQLRQEGIIKALEEKWNIA